METSNIGYSKIRIGKEDYPVFEKEVLHTSLNFYPQNPRLYSMLNIDNYEPSQEEIIDKLCDMEHVKQLRLSIEANGGLIDPLLVRDGDFVVLEGNSRLAAYKLLSKKDPTKWAYIKCKFLPSDISDETIFMLLGQYHIIGRKDWNPFEQAGYIYRRIENGKISIENSATELGLRLKDAKSAIEVYTFMKEMDDLVSQHWSYYVEYLKSRSIKKYRAMFPVLDEVLVKQIKGSVINNAIDIRQKLEPITKLSEKKATKILREYISEEKSLDECFEDAESTGKTSDIYRFLFKFRTRITEEDTQRSILYAMEDKKASYRFELKKIQKAVEKLLVSIDRNSMSGEA